MSYDDDDFEDVFRGFDFFNSKFIRRFQSEIDEVFEEIKSGKIKGTWQTREINEPGVKGYIIQGRFESDRMQEPLEPLKPLRRRPMPERPFELSKRAMEEMREPLTDIFEEENATKIYVELPGEEKDDIQLNFKEGGIEIKSKSFHKFIELPEKCVAKNTLETTYKNGVLKITIPKKAQLRKEDSGKERMV